MNFIYSHQLKNKIYRFALKLLNDTDEAKDITQNVFEKLLLRKETPEDHHNLTGLAIKITRDMCFDRIRHLQRKAEKLNQLQYTSIIENTNTYETRDLIRIVEILVEQLPEKQRVVFQLRDIQELEFEEISELLDMDANNVRMNLSRARKTISNQLQKIQNYGLR